MSMSLSDESSGDELASPQRSAASSVMEEVASGFTSAVEPDAGVGEGEGFGAGKASASAAAAKAAAPALSFWKESRVYLNIAWPIVVSNLCMTGMGLTDIAVLGNFHGNDTEHLNTTGTNTTVATDYLAAASLSNIWQSLSSVVIWQGFAAALSVLAATAYGAKNYRLVGVWLYLTVVVCSLACLPIGLSWVWAADIMGAISAVSDNLRGLITSFSDVMLIGLMPQQWYCCVNLFLVAQGIVLPQVILSALALGANFGFNFFYIYGIPAGGFDGLGFRGSPLATSSSQWFRFLALMVYLVVARRRFTRSLCFCRRRGRHGLQGLTAGRTEGQWDPPDRLRVGDGSADDDQGGGSDPRSALPVLAGAAGSGAVGAPGGSSDAGVAALATGDGARGSAERGGNTAGRRERPPRSFCQEICTGSRLKEYFKQAVPLAVTGVLEEGQIQVIAIMASDLSTEAIATHNALLAIVWFLTSAMWAVSSTTRVRISYHLGAGDVPGAKQVIKISLLFGGGFGVAVACVFIFGRNFVGHIYSNDPVVWAMSAEISLLVGVGYALMTFFYVCMGTLAAQGRTTVIAVAFVAGAWCVAVPCAYLFAFKWTLTLGLQGLWLGLIAGYAVVSIVSVVAVCRSDWEGIVVDAAKRAEKSVASPRSDSTATAQRQAASGDAGALSERLLQDPVGGDGE